MPSIKERYNLFKNKMQEAQKKSMLVKQINAEKRARSLEKQAEYENKLAERYKRQDKAQSEIAKARSIRPGNINTFSKLFGEQKIQQTSIPKKKVVSYIKKNGKRKKVTRYISNTKNIIPKKTLSQIIKADIKLPEMPKW